MEQVLKLEKIISRFKSEVDISIQVPLYLLVNIGLNLYDRFILSPQSKTHAPVGWAEILHVLLLWFKSYRSHQRLCRKYSSIVSPFITAHNIWDIHTFKKFFFDTKLVAFRRENNLSKEILRKKKGSLKALPPYYLRNFHFQTDGYLSKFSASIYDYQVEVLFGGLAQAMRHTLTEELLQLEGIRKILEIGSGTGSSAKVLGAIFPNAKMILTDFSKEYLSYAKDHIHSPSKKATLGSSKSPLSKSYRFLHIQKTNDLLKLQPRSFDLISHTFLLHELPLSERKKLSSIAYDLLKPGGYMAVIDSLQKGDEPSIDWALEAFPQKFHEPFYKNYLRHPTEDLLREANFNIIRTNKLFFSKGILAKKSA